MMTEITLSNDLAFFIDESIAILDFASLFILLLVTAKIRVVSSGLLALIVAVFIGLVTHLYAPKLLSWGAEYPDNTELVRFVWYIGFANINLMGIFLVRKCNEWLNVHPGRMARVILLAFFTIGLLNLVTYLVIIVTGKNLLDFFYRSGTLAINLMATITCFYLVLAYSVGVYRFKRGLRGKMWAI